MKRFLSCCILVFATVAVNAQSLGNAVVQGDNARIREFLHQGEDPNGRNAFGISLFFSACFIAPKSSIELLLANGGDPTSQNPLNGETPLMLVIRRFGDIQLVDAFLKRNADVNIQSKDGWTALMDAVSLKENALPLSEKLVASGANVHAKTKEGSTVLFWAADSAIVNLLVSSGVAVNDVNVDGDSALLMATKFMRMGAMNALVKHGANVNVRNKQGETPLLVAVRSEGGDAVGDFAYSRLLLDAGADVKAISTDGNTTLMYAVNEVDIGDGRQEARSLVIKELLERGANINAQSNRGVSALMLASGKGNSNATKLLINSGANPNQADSDGATPLMWALDNFNLSARREISASLIAAGAGTGHKRNDGKTVLDLAGESFKLELQKLVEERKK